MRICVESAIARLVRIGLIGSGAWSVVGGVGSCGWVCVEAAVYGGVGGAWRVVFDGWRFTEGVSAYLYDSLKAIFWTKVS